MSITSHKMLKALAVVLCWLPVVPAAEPIYKWEGADGSTHYSHSPPAADAGVDYDVLELGPATAQPHVEGDYRSILDAANSLQAARLERERLRLERERAALERQRLRQEAQPDADDSDPVVPGFVVPHRVRPPHGPGKRGQPHPDQPRVHRPPEAAPEPPPRDRAVVGR